MIINYIFQDILALLKDINKSNVWLTLSSDYYVLKRVIIKNKYTCQNAAENGHLEVLKWARENGCPWNELTCSCAAKMVI